MKVADLSGTRILVIDDYELVLETVTDTLEVMGASVLQARNGRIGIEMALEHRPDLVLSNHSMPEAGGLDVLKALRADERTAHVPFVLMTAVTSSELRTRTLELGADAYLDKSTGLVGLVQVVSTLLERNGRGSQS